MGIYIELISNLIQTITITWFITNFFGFKRENKLNTIPFILVWLLVFVEISFMNAIILYEGILAGISILTYIMYARIFLKGRLEMHCFISIFSFSIIFATSTIFFFVGISLSGETVIDFATKMSLIRTVLLFLLRILEFIIFKAIIRVNSEYALTMKEWFLFTTMPFLTWIMMTFLSSAVISSYTVLPQMLYASLIMLAVDIVIYYFMFKIKQDSGIKLNYELLKMQYNNIISTEANMKALYESTYSLKHDLDKHLFAVKELADKNACSEISSYIKHIIKDTEKSVQKVVFTDNDIFNAVINTKLELCRQKNIVTIVNIDNAAVTYLDNKYISVLFGNLLDNAIEAAEKAEPRLINISVTQKGNYISVCTENTYNKNYSDITLKTTKKNDFEHGFGTKNIRKVVEENNGMIQYFTNENGLFCCDILLEKAAL